MIDLPSDSKALNPIPERFIDRRVAKLEVDKVKQLVLKTDRFSLTAKRLPQGGWSFVEPEERAEEADVGSRVDKLLWALRDFRVQGESSPLEPSGKDEWRVKLKIPEGKDLEFRFGRDKTGKPFVGFEDKLFFAQEDLVPALDDAVKALAPSKGAVAPK